MLDKILANNGIRFLLLRYAGENSQNEIVRVLGHAGEKLPNGSYQVAGKF